MQQSVDSVELLVRRGLYKFVVVVLYRCGGWHGAGGNMRGDSI